jgi:hypothetical protein
MKKIAFVMTLMLFTPHAMSSGATGPWANRVDGSTEYNDGSNSRGLASNADVFAQPTYGSSHLKSGDDAQFCTGRDHGEAFSSPDPFIYKGKDRAVRPM